MTLAVFLAWLALAYLLGAIPWSVWLGRTIYGVDPRQYGDGNPGTANAFRAGGKQLGVAVLLLDFLKAFVPVLLAKYGLLLPPEQLFWIALAPTVGHAFSVFLGFRGGRALVTLFGVWCGLTLYEAPLVMGAAAIVFTLTLKKDELSSIAILIVLLGYQVLREAESWMSILAVAQMVVLVVKIGPVRFVKAVVNRQTAFSNSLWGRAGREK